MSRVLVVTALLMPLPVFAADKPVAGTPVGGIGVLSVDEKTLFVPAKGGGIEAVELATGKPLWTNKDASKLAGASDKFVLAWVGEKKGNEFRVVVMDAATGKTLGKSDPIAMPEWATTGKTWGRSFRAAARVEGEAVVVAWQAGAFYAGGARPTPEIEAAARKSESGLTKFDPKTGKMTPAKEKPKEEDFNSSPSGRFQPKAAGYEFRTSEELPGLKPGSVTKVTLSVLKDGKEVWSRELAGNPFSPPPP